MTVSTATETMSTIAMNDEIFDEVNESFDAPKTRRTRVRCRRRRGRGGKRRGSQLSWWDYAPHPTDENGDDLEASDKGFPVLLPSGQGVFLLPSAANPQFAATYLAAVKTASEPVTPAVEPVADTSPPTAFDDCTVEYLEGSTDDSLSSCSADSSASSSASTPAGRKDFNAAVGPRSSSSDEEGDIWDRADNDSWSDRDDLSTSSELTSISSASSCADSLGSISLCSASWASFHDCLTRPSILGASVPPTDSMFELDPLPELAASDEAFDSGMMAALSLDVDELTGAECPSNSETLRTISKEESQREAIGMQCNESRADLLCRRLHLVSLDVVAGGMD